jgi:hypothetical protein
MKTEPLKPGDVVEVIDLSGLLYDRDCIGIKIGDVARVINHRYDPLSSEIFVEFLTGAGKQAPVMSWYRRRFRRLIQTDNLSDAETAKILLL